MNAHQGEWQRRNGFLVARDAERPGAALVQGSPAVDDA
jgi:hypothetical protein